jgi:hypothetical protein
MTPIVLEPAKKEMREAYHWYEEQRPGLGDEFLDAVDEAMARIDAFPNAWTRLSSSVRRCRTNRFPNGIVFCVRGEQIIVLAVIHLKRRPEYWRDRLKELSPDESK